MGRNQKVSAQEVLEILQDSVDQLSAKELGEIFDVTSVTIRNRIKDLRSDGEAIIHDKNGFLKVNKENIQEEDVAQIMDSFTSWLLSTLKGAYICANPTVPLLPAMKRSLKLNMSVDERRLLSKSCVKLKALCDHVEAEEDY